MSASREAPDLDAETEVDLGRYGRALLARWWLLLAGLLAGAVVGYLTTLGGTQFYRAQEKIKILNGELDSDTSSIDVVNKALSSNLSSTDKLILQLQLRNYQSDRAQTAQLLALATNVEAPYISTFAAAQRTAARNH